MERIEKLVGRCELSEGGMLRIWIGFKFVTVNWSFPVAKKKPGLVLYHANKSRKDIVKRIGSHISMDRNDCCANCPCLPSMMHAPASMYQSVNSTARGHG